MYRVYRQIVDASTVFQKYFGRLSKNVRGGVETRDMVGRWWDMIRYGLRKKPRNVFPGLGFITFRTAQTQQPFRVFCSRYIAQRLLALRVLLIRRFRFASSQLPRCRQCMETYSIRSVVFLLFDLTFCSGLSWLLLIACRCDSHAPMLSSIRRRAYNTSESFRQFVEIIPESNRRSGCGSAGHNCKCSGATSQG